MRQRVNGRPLVAAISVRKSMALAVVIAAVATVSVALAGLMQMRMVADRGRTIYTTGVLPTAEVGKLRELVWRARFESLSGTTAIDAPTKAKYDEQFTTTLREIDSTVALFRQHDLSAEQFASINQFATSWSAYLTAREEGQRMRATGDVAAWEQNRQNKLTPATNSAYAALDALDQASQRAASTTLDQTNSAVGTAQTVIIAIMAGGVLLSIALLGLLSRATEQTGGSDDSGERLQATIRHGLPEAIDRGELDLRFQPVVDLATRRPVGVEATLSWEHPIIGSVAADELLLAAEEVPASPEVATWALNRVCQQLAEWHRDGHQLWISLNVPAQQLAKQDFAEQVKAALDRHGAPAANLMIELDGAELPADGAGATARHGTGQGPAAGVQAVGRSVATLRAMGIRVAVDHFGTGAPAMGTLQALPMDLFKISSRLCAEPSGRPGGAAASAIAEIVELGQRLGVSVEVAARGLVEQSDIDAVRAAGCRYGQGELFSRPVSAETLKAHLGSRTSTQF